MDELHEAQARKVIAEAFDKGEGKPVDRQLFAAGVMVLAETLSAEARRTRKAVDKVRMAPRK